MDNADVEWKHYASVGALLLYSRWASYRRRRHKKRPKNKGVHRDIVVRQLAEWLLFGVVRFLQYCSLNKQKTERQPDALGKKCAVPIIATEQVSKKRTKFHFDRSTGGLYGGGELSTGTWILGGWLRQDNIIPTYTPMCCVRTSCPISIVRCLSRDTCGTKASGRTGTKYQQLLGAYNGRCWMGTRYSPEMACSLAHNRRDLATNCADESARLWADAHVQRIKRDKLHDPFPPSSPTLAPSMYVPVMAIRSLENWVPGIEQCGRTRS